MAPSAQSHLLAVEVIKTREKFFTKKGVGVRGNLYHCWFLRWFKKSENVRFQKKLGGGVISKDILGVCEQNDCREYHIRVTYTPAFFFRDI